MNSILAAENPRQRVVACVIARMHSTRLPKKALVDVNGRPALEWLVDRLRHARNVDDIVLCTSTNPADAVLVQFAEDLGIGSFAGSEDDVLSRLVMVADQEAASHVLRVTGDNILTDPRITDWLVESALTANADYARVNSLPLGIAPEVLASRMLRPLHAGIPNPNWTEYMVLWAFDPAKFRCLVLEAPREVSRPTYSLTLDTDADLALFRGLLATVPPTDLPGPGVREIVRYLDSVDRPVADLHTLVKLPTGNAMPYSDFLNMLAERTARSRAAVPAEEYERHLVW